MTTLLLAQETVSCRSSLWASVRHRYL